MGGHFPEVFRDVPNNIPGLLDQAAASRNIAGILVGNRLREFSGKLQPALADIFGKEFYTVNDLELVIFI
jgi:hypothetical protein